MVSRNADLYREWEGITDAHEQVIDDYETSFQELLEGRSPDPLAIVGAYGSGKTQLMYQIFRRAWEQNIGAVYVGDPGKLLAEFKASDESEIDAWLEQRIPEEVAHYISGSPDDVSWFPNTEPEKKAEWLTTAVTVDDPSNITKYALLVDEVEQHYEDFLAVIETDDDNPLRIINDEVSNTLKVWSFGMLSAYEFLGEADWRRLKELRVPPLNVEEVKTRLEQVDESLSSLANILWWMGRGRTGLIIKLIDELPNNVLDDINGWLESQADGDPQGTPVINDIWANLASEHWEAACRSLAFQEGYDDWLMQDTEGYSSETMTDLISNILFDMTEFPDTDHGRTAKRILRRNIYRVFDAVIRPDQPYLPYKQLMFENAEIEGLLSLVEDQILTFEPKGPARKTAIEALDIASDEFTSEFYNLTSDKSPVTGGNYFAPKFSILDDAFQPIALNPSLISETDTNALRKSMDSALEFDVSSAHERMSVYFCPTQDVFEHQLRMATNNYDITSPSVIIAPTELTENIPADYDTFRQLNLLTIAPHESSMLWDFVINLQGVLDEQGIDPSTAVSDSSRQQLLEVVETRDARNTIDTLFDQLQRVASDEATRASEKYISRYSLPNESTLLWENTRLQDQKPFWTSGDIRELTRAQAFLLVLSDSPEFNRPYAELHTAIKTALDDNLILGGANFPYTEFFNELYTSSGFTERIATERRQYFEDGQLVDGVRNTQNALYRLAKEFDLEMTVETLNDTEAVAQDGDITILDINASTNALAFLRALLMNKILLADEGAFDLAQNLEKITDELVSYQSAFGVHLDSIHEYDSILSPPSCADVGSWPELNPDKYQEYHDFLEKLINGIEDLCEQVELTPGLRSYGWTYLLMMREFTDQASEAVDKCEMGVNTVELTNITLLKESYTDLYQTLVRSDNTAIYFESENQLQAQLETIGNEIFDFGDMHRIPLPEHADQLNKINEEAQETVKRIEEVRDLVDQLYENHEAVDMETKNLRGDLRDLLTQAVDQQEDTA